MKRRRGRLGRRPQPGRTRSAVPLWMPFQPPVEDVRLINEQPVRHSSSLHPADQALLFGAADPQQPLTPAELRWVVLRGGHSVN